MQNAVNVVSAVSAALMAYLFGPMDALFFALLACMGMDYLSGVIAAYIEGTLSSKKGFVGLSKKLLILCVTAVGTILDNATGANGMLRALVLGFYVANECISLLENAGRLGVPLPRKLLDALEQVKAKNE